MDRSRDLLADAEDFLAAAQDLLKTGRWSKVCFSSQQAAELGLKAVLNRLGVERRGDALTELLEEVSSHLPEARKFEDHAKLLDQYYNPTRYANAYASGPAKDRYTETQARQAVQLASELLSWVKKLSFKDELRRRALESVHRFVDELEAAGHVVKSVVLFGSYAKDTFTEASDVDFCVVCEHLPKNVWGLPDLTTLPRVRGVQPLAYTAEDFLDALRKLSPVALDIVHEGIVLRDDGFMKQAKTLYEELHAKHGPTRWKDGWKWRTTEAQQ